MNIEIVNYGDDYKFNPVPDANYFSWGVKVKAAAPPPSSQETLTTTMETRIGFRA